MTTTDTPNEAPTPAATAPIKNKVGADTPPAKKPTNEKDAPTLVTLDQLAREMKMSPRDVRMLLRLAAKQTKLYPTLGKEHVARQPWSWTPGSKALEESRKALTAANA